MTNETTPLDPTAIVLKAIADVKEGQKDNVKKADIETLETSLKADIKVTADEVDKLKATVAKIDEKAGILTTAVKQEVKSFNSLLADAIADSTDLIGDMYKSNTSKKFATSLKAVGDMSFANNFTNADRSVSDLRPGIEIIPSRKLHIRDLLSQGTMSTRDFIYVRETVGEGAVTYWQSGAKSQIDFDLTETTATARTIAGYVTVPKEMLADVAALTSFLQMRLMQKYLNAEDQQILYGAGTGVQLNGLTVAATGTASSATRIYDKIVLTAANIASNDFQANAVLVDPVSFAQMTLNQTTAKEYSYPINFNAANGTMQIAGLQVFQSTAVTAGNFLIGDWASAAQLLIREAPNVQFSTEEGTNFTKNLVTIRVEGRVALPIYQTGAWAYSTVGVFS